MGFCILRHSFKKAGWEQNTSHEGWKVHIYWVIADLIFIVIFRMKRGREKVPILNYKSHL